MGFLPADDIAYLRTKGLEFEEVVERDRMLVIRNFPLPAGIVSVQGDGQRPPVSQADVLIVIPPGYNSTCLDSFYTFPRLGRAPAGEFPATSGSRQAMGRQWQFWSRHLDANSWRPGIDGLHVYLKYIEVALRGG